MTFADKLRQLRDAAGLTQEQMAERSGITLWTIRGYEQGRRDPNWKGMLSLAKALNVAAEVFCECDESTPEKQSARPRGRPSRPETTTGTVSNHSEPKDMPPAQRKPRERKTRRPRGG
jgi:transcriptional regulator with XRE-family HTH domain